MNAPADADTIVANVPDELRRLPRFVLWRSEPRCEGEPCTKIPYSPRYLGRAKSNDSTTWATFDECLAELDRHPGRFAGLGFVLGDDAPYAGVDLDDSLDDDGHLYPRAKVIVDRFATYSEVSPSGHGVKMFMRGTMPTPDGTGKNYRKDPWGTGTGGIEFYRRGRFFTLTGNHVPGTPLTVEDRTAQLASLYRELYPPAPARPFKVSIDPLNGNVHRAAAYLAKLSPSVSGAGGHNALLHAACTLVRFGLGDGDALALLHDYNRRADPPWSEAELERKLREARKLAGHEAGAMLADRQPQHHSHHPVRRFRRVLVVMEGGAR